MKKGATGVRPLACGDPLRRLVGKCFCLGASEEIAAFFKGRNYGVGCPGGVEVVAHSLRDVCRKHAESTELGLLKIDFSNAFNQVDRQAFMRATTREFPGLANWTNWCYGQKSMLLYDHKDVIDSARVYSRVIRWALCTSVLRSLLSLRRSLPLGPCTRNGTWMTAGSSPRFPSSRRCGSFSEKGPPVGLLLNPKKCECRGSAARSQPRALYKSQVWFWCPRRRCASLVCLWVLCRSRVRL